MAGRHNRERETGPQPEREKLERHLLLKGYADPFFLFIPQTGFYFDGPLKECLDYYMGFIKSNKADLLQCELVYATRFTGFRSATRCTFIVEYSRLKGFHIPQLRIRTPGFNLDFTRNIGQVENIPSHTQVRDFIWVEKAAKNKTKSMRK